MRAEPAAKNMKVKYDEYFVKYMKLQNIRTN